MTQAKPFIELLKRALKSKYPVLFMQNRLLMQCYDLAEDSDVGLHYVLFIPDTAEYQDSFYEERLILKPKDIIAAYSEVHSEADAERKKLKLKPKELHEEFCLKDGKVPVLKFSYFIQGELFGTKEIALEYIDYDEKTAVNVSRTYNALLERIDTGDFALRYDGIKLNLQNRIVGCPEIYFYNVRVGKNIIRIPFSRSTFVGLTKLKKFEIVVLKTTIPDVYAYATVLGKNGIEELFWGYFINF